MHKLNEDFLLNYLKNKYNPLSIILYGSFSTNQATANSDIDIICIVEKKWHMNDNSIVQGHALDAWIYTKNEIENPDQFLRISDGKVLYDTDDIGKNMLSAVKVCIQKDPAYYTSEQIKHCVHWYEKMISRSMVGDVEGNFRKHWLLFDMLETYFRCRKMWYFGPKKAFQYLKYNDPEAYEFFSRCLGSNCNRNNLESLAKIVLNDIK